MIRILLVDDHEAVRGLMCNALNAEKDMTVVGGLPSGESTLENIEKIKPCIVVMDITLPGMDGIEVTQALRTSGNNIPVLCMTMHLSHPVKERAFRAGAKGYVLKHDSFNTLLDAVRIVSGGGQFVSPVLMSNKDDIDSAELLSSLSRRELEIISYVASGWTAGEIASFLKISQRTVDFHRRSISQKTGLRRIADITKFALQVGLKADD
jgi:DNA-binding NarL/FixJ family response regulator